MRKLKQTFFLWLSGLAVAGFLRSHGWTQVNHANVNFWVRSELLKDTKGSDVRVLEKYTQHGAFRHQLLLLGNQKEGITAS